MTVGELRTLTALVGELGSTNFTTAISANFGNLADDAEVALDVVAVLFPPSAPFECRGRRLAGACRLLRAIHSHHGGSESNRRRSDDSDPRRSCLSFVISRRMRLPVEADRPIGVTRHDELGNL